MMDEKPLTQAEKFRQAARNLGCEESEESFDAKLRTIAKQKLKDPPDDKRDTNTPAAKKR